MTIAGSVVRWWVREALADGIRRARRRAHLSRRELAARVGIAPAELGRIERGEVGVSVALLWRLVDALGMLPGELVSAAARRGPPRAAAPRRRSR